MNGLLNMGRWFTIVIGVSYAFSSIAAVPPAALTRADLRKIKIIGNRQDHISFYLTDKQANKYRISNLTQQDAETILGHFKTSDKGLILRTAPNKRGYHDVLEWRREP